MRMLQKRNMWKNQQLGRTRAGLRLIRGGSRSSQRHTMMRATPKRDDAITHGRSSVRDS
jgi:hypothetical protein